MEIVKNGQIPSKEQRRGLSVRTNQLHRWFRYLYIDEGLLYIQKPGFNGGSEPRVLVSMGLQRKLIYQAYKGHSGISETLTKLNCIQCLQKSNQVPLSQSKPMHRELLSNPMQRVYIDIVGLMVKS